MCFHDAGLVLSTKNAQAILDASENIPYYLQAIASLAFECATDKNRREVRPADISTAIETFIAINSELYDERLHRLSVTSTLHTALGELVDAGLVDRTPTEIRLADPLFARSIRGRSATVFTS